MAGRIDFFCDANEERAVFEYLLGDDAVAFEPALMAPGAVEALDFETAPEWPGAFACYFWLRRAGPLQWHVAAPAVEGATHGELVNNLLARETWADLDPATGVGFVNADRSPILLYERHAPDHGLFFPSALVCPTSSPDLVSPEYARWGRAVWGWIRRRTVRVHDWKRHNPALRNDLRLASSVYAFPNALASLTKQPEAFAISVR